MPMNHGTYMRQSNDGRHSDENSGDKAKITMDTQQDSAGVNNPIMPRL